MKKWFSMKRFLVLIATCLVALCLVGCGEKDGSGLGDGNEDTLTVALGQTTAYFTNDDEPLYPIQGETLGAGDTYIEKEIKVVFSKATRIALAFVSEDEVPSGLKFTVNGGEVKDFALGEFYTADTEEGETEHKVKVKVWLAQNAPDDIAGEAFEFSIKAMGE